MAQGVFQPSRHADLLRRVFDLPSHGLSRALAEQILNFNFLQEDAQRAEELNDKANEGLVNEGERSELEAYADVADLLAYWQLKAKQALKQAS